MLKALGSSFFLLLSIVCTFIYAGTCRENTSTSKDQDVTSNRDKKPTSAKKNESYVQKSESQVKEEITSQKPLTRMPTTQDPHRGSFTLDHALEGMETSFDPKHDALYVSIKTSEGILSCKLFHEKAPITVANFVGLARGTRPWWDAKEAKWVKKNYYTETTFHRIIPGFMIQGGDYLRDGTGSVGFEIRDEVHPDLRHDKPGLLCMANRGPNTNGGQFFITDGSASHLDGSYTIFGTCTPLNLISMIAQEPQSGPPKNQPNDPVIIHNVHVRIEPKKESKKNKRRKS